MKTTRTFLKWVWAPALAALGVMAVGSFSGCGAKESAGAAPLEPTWENVHKEVLLTSCAFSSCHGERSPAANIDFTRVESCGQIVGGNSCVRRDRLIVFPSEPSLSYLYSKVTGTDLGTPATAKMDKDSCYPHGDLPSHMPPTDKLAADKVELIRAWIAIGAPCAYPKPVEDAGAQADAMVMPEASAPQVPVSLTGEVSSVKVGEQAVLTVKLAGPVDYGAIGGTPVKLSCDASACCSPERCAEIGLAICLDDDTCAANGGQIVKLDVSNPEALAVPPSMTVIYSKAGNDTGQFAVQGIAPASGVVVKATVGDTTVEMTLDVVP